MNIEKYKALAKSWGGNVTVSNVPIGKVVSIITPTGINICSNMNFNDKFYKNNFNFFKLKMDMGLDKDIYKNYII